VHDHGRTFSLERNLEVAPDHEEEDAAHGRMGLGRLHENQSKPSRLK
jgi:hypothetical protein